MNFPGIPRTRTIVQSVPEHEIHLVFDGDEDAEKFSDWLETLGWKAFVAWASEMQHDVEHHEKPSGLQLLLL